MKMVPFDSNTILGEKPIARMVRFSGVLVLVWLMLTGAGFGFGPDQETEGGQADAHYLEYCAICHGKEMEGGNASSLLDGDWQFGASRTAVFENIKHGIPAREMPAFAAALTDAQIRQLVDLIRGSENRADRAPPAPNRIRTLDYKVDVEVFAWDLEIPWAIDFIDQSTALITEKPGRLRVVKEGKLISEPVQGIPEVLFAGQGGLLDVAVDPEYPENGWIYLSYSHALEGSGIGRAPAMTRIVRGRIKNNTWTDQEVVFEAEHNTYRKTRHHYGNRIVFDPQGYLYFSIGDRGAKQHAQDPSRPNGKVHRIHRDGSIPEDNPFVDEADAIPSIFTYGHRNPQGLAVHPETGEIWVGEHGPRGGDELNLLKAGNNYGWPEILYGINYNGTVLSPDRRKPGMEQPIMYWRPSIAVCGIDFYEGELFSYWKHYLLVAALKYKEVRLLNIEGDRVMHQEVILKDVGRIREAVGGPDGAIYVVVNKPHLVLRLTPVDGWQPK